MDEIERVLAGGHSTAEYMTNIEHHRPQLQGWDYWMDVANQQCYIYNNGEISAIMSRLQIEERGGFINVDVDGHVVNLEISYHQSSDIEALGERRTLMGLRDVYNQELIRILEGEHAGALGANDRVLAESIERQMVMIETNPYGLIEGLSIPRPDGRYLTRIDAMPGMEIDLESPRDISDVMRDIRDALNQAINEQDWLVVSRLAIQLDELYEV